MSASPHMAIATVEHSHSEWQQTRRKAVPSILQLICIYTVPFDKEEVFRSPSTAFVVDKARGIAMTNLHCVTHGPAIFSVRFCNGEEIPAYNIYVDPLHDFAFVRFDPSSVTYMAVEELGLDPTGATKGLDVMVFGNDSLEPLTPIRGVIFETHSNPSIDLDWNVSYITVTTVIRPGSSGAPLIDIRGKALGIMSNSTDLQPSAAVLRLERVVRALDIIKTGFYKNGKGCWSWRPVIVPRKSTFANFSLDSVEEVTAYQLLSEDKRALLFGDRKNVLCVEGCIGGGSLQTNDAVLQVDGVSIHTFEELESLEDDTSKNAVTVTVLRADEDEKNVVKLEFDVDLIDLNWCTPRLIVDICGSSFHCSSPSFALRQGLKPGSLVMSSPGDLFRDAGIQDEDQLYRLNGRGIRSFERFLKSLHISLTNNDDMEIETSNGAVVIDKGSYQKSRIYFWKLIVEEKGFIWKKSVFTIPSIGARDTESSSHDTENSDTEEYEEGTGNLGNYHEKPVSISNLTQAGNLKSFGKSLTEVCFMVPSAMKSVGGFSDTQEDFAQGIVVYHSLSLNTGIILVLHEHAPTAVGRTYVTFKFNEAEIEAKVVFEDYARGFSLISYIPCDLGPDAEYVFPATLSPCGFIKGEILYTQQESEEEKLNWRKSSVTSVELNYDYQFVQLCEEYESPPHKGIVLDEEFRLKGLCLQTSDNGLKVFPSYQIVSTLFSLLTSKETPRKPMVCAMENMCLPNINASFRLISKQKAIFYCLPYQYVVGCPRDQFLQVHYCFPGENHSLQAEDILLSINGIRMSCRKDLEHALRVKQLCIRVLRGGVEQDVLYTRDEVKQRCETRMIKWCGNCFQETPMLRIASGFVPSLGVFASYANGGNFNLRPYNYAWITHINGKSVKDLDGFVKCISMLKDGESFMVHFVIERGRPLFEVINLDLCHFPTSEIKFDHATQSLDNVLLQSS